MATTRKMLTAEEFSWLPDDGTRQELVRGEVITSPPARPWHGAVAIEVAFVFGEFIRRHALGQMYAAETGFWIESDPDTVRAPDFAFLSAARRPTGASLDMWEEGMVPDLIVEVVSPSDSARGVREKMEQWIGAGVRLGIVAYPRTRSVAIYRPSGEVENLGSGKTLDGGDVLPGFSCRVGDFFPE